MREEVVVATTNSFNEPFREASALFGAPVFRARRRESLRGGDPEQRMRARWFTRRGECRRSLPAS